MGAREPRRSQLWGDGVGGWLRQRCQVTARGLQGAGAVQVEKAGPGLRKGPQLLCVPKRGVSDS